MRAGSLAPPSAVSRTPSYGGRTARPSRRSFGRLNIIFRNVVSQEDAGPVRRGRNKNLRATRGGARATGDAPTRDYGAHPPAKTAGTTARASPRTTCGDSPNHHGTRRPGVEAAKARGRGRATATAKPPPKEEVMRALFAAASASIPAGRCSAATAGDGMTIGFRGGQELGQKHGSANASGGARQECAHNTLKADRAAEFMPRASASPCHIGTSNLLFFEVLLFIIGSTQSAMPN